MPSTCALFRCRRSRSSAPAQKAIPRRTARRASNRRLDETAGAAHTVVRTSDSRALQLFRRRRVDVGDERSIDVAERLEVALWMTGRGARVDALAAWPNPPRPVRTNCRGAPSGGFTIRVFGSC